MSSSASPGPWKAIFQTHLSHASSPEFVFSTIETNSPRARYCIFRSFWAELPENHRNTAPRNPRVYESDLLAFTTDVRMNKAAQVISPADFSPTQSQYNVDSSAPTFASGGGGPCEAVFWIKELKVQWRLRGDAFILGPDIDGDAKGPELVRKELGKRMREVDPTKKGEWSWSREVTGQFGNLSPGMRGSFANRPPGKPVSEPLADESQYVAQGSKVDDLDHAIARQNFRVVVIRPYEVEWTDLEDPSKSRRRVYTLRGAAGEAGTVADADWDFVETWP